MRMPDNEEIRASWEAWLEKRQDERPVCEYCGKPIQEDSYYYINGENLCERCLDEHFKIDVTWEG